MKDEDSWFVQTEVQ